MAKIQENIERDDKIDKELLFRGWTVIHFWGNDILKHTDECVKIVKETIFSVQLNNDNVLDEID